MTLQKGVALLIWFFLEIIPACPIEWGGIIRAHQLYFETGTTIEQDRWLTESYRQGDGGRVWHHRHLVDVRLSLNDRVNSLVVHNILLAVRVILAIE